MTKKKIKPDPSEDQGARVPEPRFAVDPAGNLGFAVASRPKGKFAHTKEWYDALVQAYLMHPGNHTAVANDLGITRHTARKVWNEGWVRHRGTGGLNAARGNVSEAEDERRAEPIEWAPPIREKIAEYQAFARARLEDERARLALDKEERGKTLAEAAASAKRDLIDSRALQGRVIKQARQNSTLLLGVTGNMLHGAVVLSTKIRALLSDPNWNPKPREAMSLMRSMAEIAQRGTEMSKITDDMERRALGEPDMILGVETSMTFDEAVAEIRDAYESLQRSEKIGKGLRVVGELPAVAEGE